VAKRSGRSPKCVGVQRPPLETSGVAWNRVVGIDRSISGTRASNLSLLVGLNTRTLLPRDYRTYGQCENNLKRMEERTSIGCHPSCNGMENKTWIGFGLGRPKLDKQDANRFGSRRCLRPHEPTERPEGSTRSFHHQGQQYRWRGVSRSSQEIPRITLKVIIARPPKRKALTHHTTRQTVLNYSQAQREKN